MLKIGDIVTPKETCIGNAYFFKIIEVERQPFNDNLYKLERIEQNLDPIHGPYFSQLRKIKSVEDTLWKEDLLYVVMNPGVLNIKGPIQQETTMLSQSNLKGDKNMQILDIYKERKMKILEKELLQAKENAKKEDEIQNIILEMTNQVNTILENQGRNIKYEFQPNLITAETEVKLDELNDKYHEEVENLRSTLEEIRALFELTADYNERIKILKKYEILNKDGKLSI